MPDLFFYGTLRDALVRERVIGRAGALQDLRSATLSDFAVRRVRGTAYPMLVAEEGARAEGIVMIGLVYDEIARLDRFEGVNYRRVAGDVMLGDGWSSVEFYLPSRPLPQDKDPWVFEQWQREDRDRFFHRDFNLEGVKPPA